VHKAHFFKGLMCCVFGMSVSCTHQAPSQSPPVSSFEQSLENSSELISVAEEELPPIASGQVIYVPIYSEIYHNLDQERRTFQLTATLSLRNTDRFHPIFIELVDYYNSSGEKIEGYLDEPIQLNPLASTEIVVARNHEDGGVGANFIVEWRAATAVSEPIAEAIMISTSGQQGLSFASSGRVIQVRPSE